MHTIETTMTTAELASRFNELAQQEKWFEIQDQFFAENVQSIEPAGSPYMENAKGKSAVRKKAGDFVKKVVDFHGAHTSEPVVGSRHFAVSRMMDITVEGFGRIKLDQVMLYEVQNGMIVSEQFFY